MIEILTIRHLYAIIKKTRRGGNMSITFDKVSKSFFLENKDISYVFKIPL